MNKTNPFEFEISNKNKPVSYQQCQTIYKNTLLKMNTNRYMDEFDARLYTRALFQTQRCDQFTDLSDLRTNFAKQLGIETTSRILNNYPKKRATEFDLLQNYIVVVDISPADYRYQKVKSALDFTSRVKFFFEE